MATTPAPTDTAQEYLEALAEALRHRDHTADVTTDHAGRAVLKVGHPAVPAALTVSIYCGVADGGTWHYLWEWRERIDLPIGDVDAVADRVAAVLGVTAK